jgi:HEAT repeat protein
MERYILLWLICTTIVGIQTLFAGQDDERERTAFNVGYSMVLNKQWQSAVEQLQTFIKNHPESRYIDDAFYWNAYALRHIDKEKSAEAYRSFIKQFPGSSYIDDAVADLGTLEPVQRSQPLHVELQQLSVRSSRLRAESSRALAIQSRMIADISRQRAELSKLLNESIRSQKNVDSDTYLRIESIQALARMSRDEETFNILKNIIIDDNENKIVRLVAIHSLRSFEEFPLNSIFLELVYDRSDEDLRFYAIQHISRNKELHNTQSFQALRNIALDTSETETMRVMSLLALQYFDNINIVGVLRDILTQKNDDIIRMAVFHQLPGMDPQYVDQLKNLLKTIAMDEAESSEIRAVVLNTLERVDVDEWINILYHIAKHDHNKDMRYFAIMSFSRADKALSVQTLMELFNSTDLQDESTLGLILHSIASLGDENIIEILARVAKTHSNYEIRRYAIRMLGNIGGEKARGVLYEILTQ